MRVICRAGNWTEITVIIPNLIFSLLIALVWLILYCYCKEKFFPGHSWEFREFNLETSVKFTFYLRG